MRTAYRIKCNKGAEMWDRMGFLVRRRMVFTTNRHTDFLEIRTTYTDMPEWEYIFISHQECKKVFNTSSFSNDYDGYRDVEFVDIAWNDFVRDVLPTL